MSVPWELALHDEHFVSPLGLVEAVNGNDHGGGPIAKPLGQPLELGDGGIGEPERRGVSGHGVSFAGYDATGGALG